MTRENRKYERKPRMKTFVYFQGLKCGNKIWAKMMQPSADLSYLWNDGIIVFKRE